MRLNGCDWMYWLVPMLERMYATGIDGFVPAQTKGGGGISPSSNARECDKDRLTCACAVEGRAPISIAMGENEWICLVHRNI